MDYETLEKIRELSDIAINSIRNNIRVLQEQQQEEIRSDVSTTATSICEITSKYENYFRYENYKLARAHDLLRELQNEFYNV